MAIAFGLTASNYVGSGTSASVTIPAVSTGDLVFILGVDTATTSPSLSASSTGTALTQISTTQITSSAAHGLWYFIASSSDAGKIVTVTGQSGKIAVALASYTGCSGSSPIDVDALTAGTPSSDTHTCPNVTTVIDNDWVLQMLTCKDSTTTSWTVPGTQRVSQLGTGSGSPSAVMTDGNGAVAAGTNGGGGSFVSGQSIASANFVTWTVAIAPPTSANHAGAAALSGSGTLTAAATVGVPGGAASLSGSGTLSANAVTVSLASATLTGSGTLTSGIAHGGMYGDNCDPGEYGTGTQASAITAWELITGLPLGMRRVYYSGLPPSSISSDLLADAAAGRPVALSFKPSTSVPAPSDLATITSFLASCQANGLIAMVSMYHEPAAELGSVSTYQAVQNYYGPTVSTYYPLNYSGQASSGAGVLTNYEAYFSGIESLFQSASVDYYCANYVSGLDVSDWAAVTDAFNLPFGIWEFGVNESNQTTTNGTDYYEALATFFSGRLTDGLSNAYVSHYTADPPGVLSDPQFSSSDYQIPLYQALAQAVVGELALSPAAALSGTGTLSAGAVTTSKGTAALSGTGTLTDAATFNVPGAATLSGTGALTAAAVTTSKGSASLSGAGTLTATASAAGQSSASLAGAGTLTAGAVVAYEATVALSGAGTLTPGVELAYVDSAALSGFGVLTAAGTTTSKGTAALSGTGTLTATALSVGAGAAALSGTGVLTAAAVVTSQGAAALSGTGTLSAQTAIGFEGSATLSGVGLLSDEPSIGFAEAIALSGAGSFNATGLAAIVGNAALSGTGTLTAGLELAYISAASLAGTGILTAEPVLRLEAASALTGTGTLTDAARVAFEAAAAMSGVGLLTSVIINAANVVPLSADGSIQVSNSLTGSIEPVNQLYGSLMQSNPLEGTWD